VWTFFSDAKWDFYGYYDNLTAGNVNYLNQADATSQNLAYVTPQGTAIIKVDNSTDVPVGKNRNSIRIASNDIYPIGSLWIMDLLHIPYGCSVWPSVWTTGLPWPEYGEIDIIEGVNLGDQNQMVAHTLKGCTKTDPLNQTGTSTQTDCSVGAGCIVLEQQPNSYGSGFAQAGGGVFAAQLDASGINMWFWSRPNVPASITEATSSNTIDISTWGNPSAAYPTSSCDISQYFGAQRLTVDITLCGVWAGLPVVYQKSCTGACTVSGPGSPQYDDAYFEFNYIRGYTLPGISVFSTRALNYSTPDALSSTVTPGASSTTPVLQSSAVGATASSSSSHSSAEWSRSLRGWVLYFIAAVPVMVGCWAVWN
jgi:hypothetical protein